MAGCVLMHIVVKNNVLSYADLLSEPLYPVLCSPTDFMTDFDYNTNYLFNFYLNC